MRDLTASVLAVLLCCLAVTAQEEHHHHGGSGTGAPPAFGHVHFPISCAEPVRHTFEMGIAEMHSFEYETAQATFREVSTKDPTCAIAYWGEAMALYHPLWNEPSAQDLKDGWALVQKAQAARETSAHEKAYIDAMAAFYKPGKFTHEDRAAAYSKAMEKVHASFPDDEEAAIFYALSLLGAEPPNDTELAYPKKAVAILNEVLAKDPDHPGVTHYIIHACDNPHMAEQALPAARLYAKIAPDSAHAVHMPSHIFARLGLWQEDIASNQAAVEVAKKSGDAIEYQLHPMDFMMYAYLQIGQDDEARAVEQKAVSMPNSGFGHGREMYYYYVQAHFPAMLALETKDWKAAEALKPTPGAGPGFREMTYWAQAVGAGHLKDVNVAQDAVKNVEAASAEDAKNYPRHGVVDTELNEARAWLAYAQGKNDEAFALLKPVIERQDQVGKGEVDLPAREMYAEMLLELNRPQEALEQYELSLKTDPNRFNGLYGAGKAAEMAGRKDEAIAYYAKLVKNCEGGSANRAELAHAKDVVGAERAGM